MSVPLPLVVLDSGQERLDRDPPACHRRYGHVNRRVRDRARASPRWGESLNHSLVVAGRPRTGRHQAEDRFGARVAVVAMAPGSAAAGLMTGPTGWSDVPAVAGCSLAREAAGQAGSLTSSTSAQCVAGYRAAVLQRAECYVAGHDVPDAFAGDLRNDLPAGTARYADDLVSPVAVQVRKPRPISEAGIVSISSGLGGRRHSSMNSMT